MKNNAITSREVDFARWYTDVVNAAHLASYSSVKVKLTESGKWSLGYTPS